MIFPVPYQPEGGYKGSRGFGADRTNVAKQLGIAGNLLKHAACDLMGPPGTPILAMEDGTVVSEPYLFYPKEGPLVTYAFEVQHASFLARYCEISKEVNVHMGDEVKEGQIIAYIGDQPGWDMLHLELYDGSASGALSLPRTTANAPYYRRRDVMNPEPILDRCKATAIRDKSDTYRYETDDDGRIFLAKYSLLDL